MRCTRRQQSFRVAKVVVGWFWDCGQPLLQHCPFHSTFHHVGWIMGGTKIDCATSCADDWPSHRDKTLHGYQQNQHNNHIAGRMDSVETLQYRDFFAPKPRLFFCHHSATISLSVSELLYARILEAHSLDWLYRVHQSPLSQEHLTVIAAAFQRPSV